MAVRELLSRQVLEDNPREVYFSVVEQFCDPTVNCNSATTVHLLLQFQTGARGLVSGSAVVLPSWWHLISLRVVSNYDTACNDAMLCRC